MGYSTVGRAVRAMTTAAVLLESSAVLINHPLKHSLLVLPNTSSTRHQASTACHFGALHFRIRCCPKLRCWQDQTVSLGTWRQRAVSGWSKISSQIEGEASTYAGKVRFTFDAKSADQLERQSTFRLGVPHMPGGCLPIWTCESVCP